MKSRCGVLVGLEDVVEDHNPTKMVRADNVSQPSSGRAVGEVATLYGGFPKLGVPFWGSL